MLSYKSNVPDPDLNHAKGGRLTIFHHFRDLDSQTSVESLKMITLGISIDLASTRFRFIEHMIISVGSVTKRRPDCSLDLPSRWTRILWGSPWPHGEGGCEVWRRFSRGKPDLETRTRSSLAGSCFHRLLFWTSKCHFGRPHPHSFYSALMRLQLRHWNWWNWVVS